MNFTQTSTHYRKQQWSEILTTKSNLKITGAVLRNANVPLTLEKLEVPLLGYGQVLIKYLYSGVCRSQLMEITGARGNDKWLPHLLGHEGVGEVLKIGPGVTTVSVGEKVVAGWLETSGIDAEPASYVTCKSQEKINSGKVITFSTHAVVSENRVFTKPASFSDKLAVLLGCALPTGAGMVLNESNPSPKDKILIIGLGGIGLSVLVTLLMKGLTDISIIEPNQEKLALAKKLGARGLLKMSHCELGLSDYFDICYEASGRKTGIETGFDAINSSGTLIFASHPPAGDNICIDPFQLISGKKIFGSWGGGGKPEITAAKIADLDKHGYLENLVGKEYKLSEINMALSDLADGKVIRPIIKY